MIFALRLLRITAVSVYQKHDVDSHSNNTLCIDSRTRQLSVGHQSLFQAKIASCTSATNNWDSDNIQESVPIHLEADKPYYIEAYHNDFGGRHNVKIRVRLDKTEHTNSKVGAARDERQKITISSTVLWEKQVCPVC